MNPANPTVFVVDDDASVRQALARSILTVDLKKEISASARWRPEVRP